MGSHLQNGTALDSGRLSTEYITDRDLAPDYSNFCEEDRIKDYPSTGYTLTREFQFEESEGASEGDMTVSQYGEYYRGVGARPLGPGQEQQGPGGAGEAYPAGMNGGISGESAPPPGPGAGILGPPSLMHRGPAVDGIENIAPPGHHHPVPHSFHPSMEPLPNQHHRVPWLSSGDQAEGIHQAAFHFPQHIHDHFPFQAPYHPNPCFPHAHHHHQIILGPNGKPKRRRVATVAQRRAANIRERRRMFNLNEAFDNLRKKVPTFAYEKRLSRIETLRLAITYISFMADLVQGKEPGEIKLLTVSRCGGPWGAEGAIGKRDESAGEDEDEEAGELEGPRGVGLGITRLSDTDSQHEADTCDVGA